MKLKNIIRAMVVVCFLLSSLPVFAASNYEPLEVNIPVTCKLGGDIELTASSAECPTPAQGVIHADETSSFQITYDEPGIYGYTAKQINTTGSKVMYDKSTYTIWVHVYDLDGHLAKAVTLDDGTEVKPAEIIFENKTRSNTRGGSSGSGGSSSSKPSGSGSKPSQNEPSGTGGTENPEVKGANRGGSEQASGTQEPEHIGSVNRIAKTGEDYPYLMLILLMVFGGAGVAVTVRRKRKKG